MRYENGGAIQVLEFDIVQDGKPSTILHRCAASTDPVAEAEKAAQSLNARP